MYLESPFRNFFDDLASNKPSPGGGSVAALTGVQAVSLVLMVSNLTLGKQKYEEAQSAIEDIIKKASSIKLSLMKKVEEDIIIFNEIMSCYKIPKDKRDEPLKNALKKSAYFSLSMVKEGFEILKLANRISEIGNKNLISDAAIAVILAMSTIESSIINVRINLKSLDDENVTIALEDKMKSLLNEANEIKNLAFDTIEKYIPVR